MNTGWVKLHRKLLDNPLMRNPLYRAVWVEILLQAMYADGATVMFAGKRLKLEPGQFTTGRKKISSDTGVNESTVQRILECFESEHQIEQRTDRQCRLITVKKWKEYQDFEQGNEQRMNNERTTDEQRMNTKEERKKRRKKETKKVKTTNVVKASPRLYEDGTKVILLKDETMSHIDDRDRSFPRKRVFGNEKVDWTLDYTEHLLGRKLGGQEKWNRIYAQHLTKKYGMTKTKELLEFVCAPESWWFEKLGQISTLYKHAERLFLEKDAKQKPKNNILVIS